MPGMFIRKYKRFMRMLSWFQKSGLEFGVWSLEFGVEGLRVRVFGDSGV